MNHTEHHRTLRRRILFTLPRTKKRTVLSHEVAESFPPTNADSPRNENRSQQLSKQRASGVNAKAEAPPTFHRS